MITRETIPGEYLYKLNPKAPPLVPAQPGSVAERKQQRAQPARVG